MNWKVDALVGRADRLGVLITGDDKLDARFPLLPALARKLALQATALLQLLPTDLTGTLVGDVTHMP